MELFVSSTAITFDNVWDRECIRRYMQQTSTQEGNSAYKFDRSQDGNGNQIDKSDTMHFLYHTPALSSDDILSYM